MIIPTPPHLLRSLVIVPYTILIVAGLTVPSDGSHGLLSIKSLAFIFSMLNIILYIIAKKTITSLQLKSLAFLLLSQAFLLTWCFVSLVHNETPLNSTWDQFKIFLLTISVVLATIYLVSENIISFQRMLKTMIYANFAYSFAKLFLVIFHLLGFINMWSVIDKLGVRFMSMGIVGIIPRLQTSIDIATPFFLFFFLQAKNLGIEWKKTFKISFLVISILTIFLSFSRLLLFAGALSLFLHGITLKLETWKKFIPIFTVSLIAAVYLIGVDNVYKIVERRLFSTDTAASDDTRMVQVRALLEEYENYPVFGKGLGGYAENAIRDGKILHSYEVQWVAFLMQFGVVGLTFILFALCLIAVTILKRPFTTAKTSLFVLFICWLLAGFTNPFLISLTSGILYVLFFLTGREINLQRKQAYEIYN